MAARLHRQLQLASSQLQEAQQAAVLCYLVLAGSALSKGIEKRAPNPRSRPTTKRTATQFGRGARRWSLDGAGMLARPPKVQPANHHLILPQSLKCTLLYLAGSACAAHVRADPELFAAAARRRQANGRAGGRPSCSGTI